MWMKTTVNLGIPVVGRNPYCLPNRLMKCWVRVCVQPSPVLFPFQSVTFKTTSRNLARAMCMKNLKLTIIVAIVSIVSLWGVPPPPPVRRGGTLRSYKREITSYVLLSLCWVRQLINGPQEIYSPYGKDIHLNEGKIGSFSAAVQLHAKAASPTNCFPAVLRGGC